MSRTGNEWVERARWVRIEDEISRRGIQLKRQGAELVGPCPVCGGVDRFSINPRKGVFNCRGYGGGDVIDLVQHLDGGDFLTAVETLTGEDRPAYAPPPVSDEPKSPDEYERLQHRKAAWLWSQRWPIAGTPAEVYLRHARGITCAPPSTLGFLSPEKPGHHPALISAFAIPDEPEPGMLGAPQDVGAVHLTLLKHDGSGKAEVHPNKIMIGSPGSLPIVVSPVNDLLGLALAEGVEDALSLHQITGLGAWAAGAAGRLPALAETVPSYIEIVTISVDDDDAGRRGASQLAHHLHERGIAVDTILPPPTLEIAA